MSQEIACRITALPPSPAKRNRFLYFIVRSGKKVSEMKNESVLGSNLGGGEGCPETGHPLRRPIRLTGELHQDRWT